MTALYRILITLLIAAPVSFAGDAAETNSELQKKLAKRAQDIANLEAAYTGPMLDPYFEYYQQEIVLTLKGGKKFDPTTLKIAPLPDGKTFAFTTRWDDNTKNDVAMQEALRNQNWFGTFYLTNPDDVVMGAMTLEEMRNLGRNGDSVGTHAWTHPYLSYTSKNTQFIEIAKLRAALEARLDVSINAHAFSFVNQSHAMDFTTSRADIYEILYRSGINSVATYGVGGVYWPNRLPSTQIIKCGEWFKPEELAVYMQEPDRLINNPAFCIGIHAFSFWGKFDQAEETFAKIGIRDDSWYCNQNQYAAYRWQWMKGAVSAQQSGNQLTITLKRPKAIDLGDNMAVDIVLPGLTSADFTPPDSPLYQIKEVNGQAVLRVAHPPEMRVPEKTDFVENSANQPNTLLAGSDFPFLHGGLTENSDNSLTFQFRSDEAISNVRLTYRLPLSHQEAVVFVHPKSVNKGETFQHVLTPKEISTEYGYRNGAAFFLAQLDFLHNGIPSRAYFSTTNRHDNLDSSSYPLAGFLRSGPIPPELFTPELEQVVAAGDFTSLSATPFAPLSISEKVNKELEMEKLIVQDMEYYHAESLPVLGRWSPRYCESLQGVYLYYAEVLSPEAIDVQIRSSRIQKETGNRKEVLKAIYINGNAVERDYNKAFSSLNKGKNTVLLVVHPDIQFSGDAGAILFRIADKETGKRIKTLTYQKPSTGHSSLSSR